MEEEQRYGNTCNQERFYLTRFGYICVLRGRSHWNGWRYGKKEKEDGPISQERQVGEHVEESLVKEEGSWTKKWKSLGVGVFKFGSCSFCQAGSRHHLCVLNEIGKANGYSG